MSVPTAPRDRSSRLRYDSFGMNPRTVRFYLIEKGIDLPRQDVIRNPALNACRPARSARVLWRATNRTRLTVAIALRPYPAFDGISACLINNAPV